MRADLNQAIDVCGSLCVGLDPSRQQLELWGLSTDIDGLKEFVDISLAAIDGAAAIVKPQIAFFEQYGGPGFDALKLLITSLRDLGVFVIADAKRGDIGSTMSGYLRAWLTESGMDVNALTVHSYLGMDVIPDAAIRAELNSSRGFFALCATSNPEGELVQRSMTQGKPLARYVFDEAERISGNSDYTVGVVIGATQDLSKFGLGDITLRKSEIPILAPGYGAQGALLSDLELTFGASASMVIPSMSRELMGQDSAGFRGRILTAREQLR